ncbi:MAG TPA: T9SS type A sorting domain-containing protein, partial [Cytophaga sp.]|nr:T9SS type A sorting domain-containing protein [Cytophaga sp.]
KTYYRDADGDGYGDATNSVQLCSHQAGYVTNNKDCNDRNASVHSGTIPPKPIITGSNVLCPGGSDKLVSSAATTYLWNTGATTKTINTNTAGNYFVTITKASGCENTSDTFTVTALPCSSPAGLSVSNITSASATLHWNATNCAKKYKVQVKQGSSAWETFSNITTNSLALNNLVPGKTYKWKVQTICSTNPLTTSDFATGPNFKTASSLESETNGAAYAKANETSNVTITPNPAQNIVHIQLEGYSGNTSIQLNSLEGRKLQELKVQPPEVKVIAQEMDISKYANGMYFIMVIDKQGNREVKKLVISR